MLKNDEILRIKAQAESSTPPPSEEDMFQGTESLVVFSENNIPIELYPASIGVTFLGEESTLDQYAKDIFFFAHARTQTLRLLTHIEEQNEIISYLLAKANNLPLPNVKSSDAQMFLYKELNK